MAPHLIFFTSALSFLSGIVFTSLGLSFLMSFMPAAVLLAALWLSGAGFRTAFLAALLIVSGAFYYFLDDYRYQAQVARLPKTEKIQGIISNDPSRGPDAQSFYLKTGLGKILAKTGPYPAYDYGDTLVLEGKIEPPPQNYYGRYLAKERVAGTMSAQSTIRVASGGGSKFFSFFFGVKNSLRNSFKRLLAPEEAALLSGITLGVNEDFSKSFSQNLILSGTRHLTAVSGLHMSIVVFVVFGALAWFLPRRYAFAVTLALVGFFTALTGFTVSAVRAAFLAFAAGLAKMTGRFYNPRNALTLAALILAVINPKVPVYDIGFQLSFMAVLGIIYFKPVLCRLLRLKSNSGFLALKDTAITTLSAQLATAPILIAQFQNFSLTALVGNILVLIVIPYLLILGFLTGFLFFFFGPAARLLSFAVAAIAGYVIAVINASAKLAVLFNPNLGFIGIAVYYGILIFLIYRFYEENK